MLDNITNHNNKDPSNAKFATKQLKSRTEVHENLGADLIESLKYGVVKPNDEILTSLDNESSSIKNNSVFIDIHKL